MKKSMGPAALSALFLSFAAFCAEQAPSAAQPPREPDPRDSYRSAIDGYIRNYVKPETEIPTEFQPECKGKENYAEEARKTLKEMAAEQKKIIEEARKEQARILNEAASTGDKIVQEAKEQAKAQTTAMIEKAREEIRIEQETARRELADEVTNLSIEVAEKLIRGHLTTAEKQNALIDKLIEEARASHNPVN